MMARHAQRIPVMQGFVKTLGLLVVLATDAVPQVVRQQMIRTVRWHPRIVVPVLKAFATAPVGQRKKMPHVQTANKRLMFS